MFICICLYFIFVNYYHLVSSQSFCSISPKTAIPYFIFYRAKDRYALESAFTATDDRGKKLDFDRTMKQLRIEDIVAHEMIAEDEQILFKNGYLDKIHPTIITTGNELIGEEITAFSSQLDRWQLYDYAKDVLESTNKILLSLEYKDIKRKFGDSFKEKLKASKCISEEENAIWLIDYWCGKDVKGLIRMPFSRHHIMHVEAMCRIKNKLCKDARKGVDPIAFCGFSCNHCFLSEWCGSCRTDYNTCSFATCSPNGICPNASCCKEKGYDGCYACDDLVNCEKGFYAPGNDGANAAKAQAMYIGKYGKEEFLKVHDRLHKKYDFSKTQEILGQDISEGLRLLEES